MTRGHATLLSFREVVPPFGVTSLGALYASFLLALNGLRHTFDGVFFLEWLVARDDESGLWSWKYTSAMLFRDAISACVVSSVLVPQAMSYALLMGIPVQFGLYSAITPTFLYALFASTSSSQYGIVAPTSILANGIVASLTGFADGLHGSPEENDRFIKTQIQLAFACGVVFALMLALRLSWIANMLSQPVLNGYTFGSAILIVASQLKDLFNIPSPGSPRDFGSRIKLAFQYIGKANPVSAVMGAVALVILLYAKDVKIRGYALPKLTPVPLVVLLIGILLSWGFELGPKYKVKTIGTIPQAFPTFSVPFSQDAAGSADFIAVIPSSILLSIVGFVQTLGVGYSFAKRRSETLLPWRELLGSAIAHLFGGCFLAVTQSGSITRSAVAFDAGVATPFSGFIVGTLILVALKFLTPFLAYLPMCILAAIVTSSTRNLLTLVDIKYFWHGKKTDFAQMIVTIIGLLVLDIQNGLFVGIGFSFLLILYRAFQPRLIEVARLPGTQAWVACSRFPEARRDKGISVFRLDGELCFGNVANVEERLLKVLTQAAANQKTAAADGDGPGDSAIPTPQPGIGGQLPTDTSAHEIDCPYKFRSVFALQATGDDDENDEVTPLVGLGLRQHGGSDASTALVANTNDNNIAASGGSGLMPRGSPLPHLVLSPEVSSSSSKRRSRAHVVIFDCSRVVDVDASGARSINEVSALFRKRGIPLLLAALPGPVRDTLERYGVDKEGGEQTHVVPEPLSVVTPPSLLASPVLLSAGEPGTIPSPLLLARNPSDVLLVNVNVATPPKTDIVWLHYTRYLTVSAATAAAAIFLESQEEEAGPQ